MDDDPEDPSFRAAIGDVVRLGQRPRNVSRGPATPTPAQLNRRAHAEREDDAPDSTELTLGEVPAVAPRDVLSWKVSGVQDGVFRNLRTGRYPIDGSLDLHRKSVAEARLALLDFVRSARRRGWRCILVSHGRGERSSTPARLKSYVAFWLAQMNEVIACHSATAQHGGTGSVYVLLRKSKGARDENRERHGLKGDL
jgi:DNA-nicking Smr family endonuclease